MFKPSWRNRICISSFSSVLTAHPPKIVPPILSIMSSLIPYLVVLCSVIHALSITLSCKEAAPSAYQPHDGSSMKSYYRDPSLFTRTQLALHWGTSCMFTSEDGQYKCRDGRIYYHWLFQGEHHAYCAIRRGRHREGAIGTSLQLIDILQCTESDQGGPMRRIRWQDCWECGRKVVLNKDNCRLTNTICFSAQN